MALAKKVKSMYLPNEFLCGMIFVMVGRSHIVSFAIKVFSHSSVLFLPAETKFSGDCSTTFSKDFKFVCRHLFVLRQLFKQ